MKTVNSKINNAMADLHNKWLRCETLTDAECAALHHWLLEVAHYLHGMQQHWIAGHLSREAEGLSHIIENRKLT